MCPMASSLGSLWAVKWGLGLGERLCIVSLVRAAPGAASWSPASPGFCSALSLTTRSREDVGHSCLPSTSTEPSRWVRHARAQDAEPTPGRWLLRLPVPESRQLFNSW